MRQLLFARLDAFPSVAQIGSTCNGACSWVGGIPTGGATETILEPIFARFGAVSSVIVRQKEGENKSWALVVFADPVACNLACEQGKVSMKDSVGQVVTVVVRRANVKEELGKDDSSGLLHTLRSVDRAAARKSFRRRGGRSAPPRSAHQASRPQPQPPDAAAQQPAETVLSEASMASTLSSIGASETTEQEKVRLLSERQPSYRTMVLMRATVLNHLGKGDAAIDDLAQLAEDERGCIA